MVDRIGANPVHRFSRTAPVIVAAQQAVAADGRIGRLRRSLLRAVLNRVPFGRRGYAPRYMFGIFRKSVSVTFVDDATGSPFAQSDIPPDQLPDTFAGHQTDLEIQGRKYFVISAEPESKVDFTKSKRLTVRLRAVAFINPAELLFSLPTICGDALPEAGEPPPEHTDDLLSLHEDDWRQSEFVAASLEHLIAAELLDIQRIHAEESASVGWRRLHVRKRIPEPLPAGVAWEAAQRTLGVRATEHTVAIGGNVVRDGVALPFANGVTLWGVQRKGHAVALCIENVSAASATTVASLKRLADEFDLIIVNWCKCECYCPGGRSMRLGDTDGASLWRT